ncbi:MAG: hypothetical protein IJD39_12130 [Clostridia bacterium]|nr:hypothetical protein [Clostridia bacterium]
MNHEKMREQVHTGIDRQCASLTSDPYRVQRVLAAAHEGRKGIVIRKNKLILLIVLAMLLLSSTIALAWSLSREYFSEIAQITLTSGDYENWSLEEKRYMMTIMGKYGLLSEAEAKKRARQSEKEIDAFMLDRYAFESAPDNLSNISIDRIAWVEMGPYTDWDNETWVWYSKMMFEVGLWTEHNDVDVYETPGDEAIPPEEAEHLAEEQLLLQGYTPEEVETAWRVWHYMTHASDVNREDMVYCFTFRFADMSEEYVFLLPDGTLR